MNPSSDNDRFGGGGLEEENGLLRHSPSRQSRHLPPHQDLQAQNLQEQLHDETKNLHGIHQTHDPAEPCGRHSPLSRPRPEPENERRAHISDSNIPEEQISHLQFKQSHDPANPQPLHEHGPHLPQHPQSQLESAFRGSDLVDWLVERGLCAGRAEAQRYGVRLQQGGVLDHSTGQHRFKDEVTLLYHFTHGRGRERGAGLSQNM